MTNVDLLPALLIVAPILLATVPLALGLRWGNTGWAVTTLTTGVLFAATGYLASVVYRDGAVIHELGGFPGPVGIELVADELSTLILLLVTGTSLALLAYTRVGGPRGNTFYAAYLLLVGGLSGLSLTGDVFNMFVFLEIVGLATYGLIAAGDGPKSALAALKYLILGTLGASIYLIGVGFLFMATGTLNMIDLAENHLQVADPEYNETLVRAAFAFIFVGFAIKVAQWPVHTWQPDAYQHAPDGVTPLIAALVSTVSAYALGRIMFTVFGPEFLMTTPYLMEVVVTVGCVSVVAGSALAIIQRDVKRMFAYSSVAQFGLIVAAYGLVTETAFVGAVIHLVGHGLMKAGLFVAVGVIAIAYGARTVDEYAGLAHERPIPAASMAILLIALIGIPPSIGFIGKWYIAVGSVEAGTWPVAAVIFLSTMLTLGYAARLLEKMYFTPPRPSDSPHGGSDASSHGGAMATDGGSDGPVATDGELDYSAAADGGSAASAVTDGGRTRGSTTRVSVGMLALIVTAAVTAVVLGFAGDAFFELLDPFVEEVFN